MPGDLTPAAPIRAAGPQLWHSCHGDASRAASAQGSDLDADDEKKNHTRTHV